MSVKVFMTGRIANDLKLKKVKDNTVLEFNLACRDGKGTEFIPCTAWNAQAELIEKYCMKGSMLEIIGKLKTREYMDYTTNTRQKRWTVMVESIEFIGKSEKQTVVQQMQLLEEESEEIPYEQDFR